MLTKTWQTPFLFNDEVDRSVLWGFGVSALLVGGAIVFSGHIANYFDFPGFLLVVGGTFGATLANYSLREIGYAWKAFLKVSQHQPADPIDRIDRLVRLSQAVRTRGVMVLDREAEITRDPFIRTSFELVVDATPVDDIRRILETELRSSHERSTRAVQVFETAGTYAPALGLIGTLVGLVQMLGALNDPTTVGPAMGLALLTTLYGAVLANLIFLPVAGKLRLFNEEQWLLKSLSIEGAMSLAKQENPLVMEQRLQSFLPRKH
jgi:chemotaxis protein MotA